jgi:hypothetical protein
VKLLLLGAGASFGSAKTGIPPMGADLLDHLRRFNPPGWGALDSNLASEFREDFERGMTLLAKNNSHAMPILQRAMAAFFFNFELTSDSLYIRLASKIRSRSWQGAFITLNYERLLELSLLSQGIKYVVTQPSQGDQTELCFPHGCCHLFCDFGYASSNHVSISGTGASFDGPVKPIFNPRQFHQHIQDDAVPPVMSYFEPQKRTSAGVSFIANQRSRCSQLISQAETIIAVGIRVRPNDSHIWTPISRSNARVVYCGGTKSGAEYREWAIGARPGKSDKILNGYFADEFETLCVEAGLGN